MQIVQYEDVNATENKNIEKAQSPKNWKWVAAGAEEHEGCLLFGVNIFEYKWNITGEKITITYPKYRGTYEFDVYTVDINGITKKFATKEVYNSIYIFYVEVEE